MRRLKRIWARKASGRFPGERAGEGEALPTGREKRRFRRFASEFRIEARADGEGDPAFCETATTVDVSGEGIRFLSRRPDDYRAGQRLRLSICMPGIGGVEATLEGRGRVVRIDEADRTPEATRAGYVAVNLDSPLRFVRIPGEPPWPSGDLKEAVDGR